MPKVTVTESITLDGVMQAPGRPGEDTRAGFVHGGWARRFVDDVMPTRSPSDGVRTPRNTVT
jgi:hypothetical protein